MHEPVIYTLLLHEFEMIHIAYIQKKYFFDKFPCVIVCLLFDNTVTELQLMTKTTIIPNGCFVDGIRTNEVFATAVIRLC